MIWFLIVLLIFLIPFGVVSIVGAPFLPTLKPHIKTALDLAELKRGQTLIELGCGDGRVVAAAAKRGIRVIGYELNPFLAFVAWLRTRRYGKRVQIKVGDFWRTDWPKADAVFTFLLPKYMVKLDKKVIRYQAAQASPVKLVSFAFMVPDKVANEHREGVWLYYYN